MPAIHEHPSYGDRIDAQPSQHASAPDIELIPDARITALATAERSCCCVARPVVVAFMPVKTGQVRQTDLMLCMHHYRVSRQKLAACGARVVDASGELLTDPDPWYRPVRDR